MTATEPTRDQGAGGGLVEVLAGALASTFDPYTDHAQHVARTLAPTVEAYAQQRAEAAVAEALGDFAQWVATNRAYNGSPHDLGQSLYNECINQALPSWALSYASVPAQADLSAEPASPRVVGHSESREDGR